MPIMKESMSQANFDRMEKGLPMVWPERVIKPDAIEPDSDDLLLMTDAAIEGFEPKLLSAVRKARRNDDRVLFVGYDVSIELISKDQKKSDDITLNGWMVEGEFMKFVRHYRTTTDQQVINW